MTRTLIIRCGHASPQALGDYDPHARAEAARCPSRAEILARGLGEAAPQEPRPEGVYAQRARDAGEAQCVHVLVLDASETAAWHERRAPEAA